MNAFLKSLKQIDNYTYTENGAVALESTGNAMLDAFGSLAGMKESPAEEILNTFYAAFNEDKNLAMRLLFYVRDIRGGQGMRRVFRVIMRSLAFTHPDLVRANLDNFLFFGRGDDVLCLWETPVEADMFKWIDETLATDAETLRGNGYPTLLAKWLPSANATSPQTAYFGKIIARNIGMSEKDYRKLLSALRKRIGIVETLMSQNRWDEIDFGKLPAKAAMIYSDAFFRNTPKYEEYLRALATGDAKVNAASLFPVDIIDKVWNTKRNKKNECLFDAMWKALPDYFAGNEETGLCVVDTSGSMWPFAINVALSLGMYCADKARGPFHNHFITFSERPRLQEIKGENIYDKVDNMRSAEWMMNTDLEKVFDMILDAAVRDNLKQEDMPAKLYIISDMQFDSARKRDGKPFMETMRDKFAEAGYTMPALVYWNVRASECGMFQDTFEGENVAMVSGYSPSLFKAVIEGTEFIAEETTDENGNTLSVIRQKIDPVTVMKTTLLDERYDRVVTE